MKRVGVAQYVTYALTFRGSSDAAYSADFGDFIRDFSVYRAIYDELEATKEPCLVLRLLDVGKQVKGGTRSWTTSDLQDIIRWKRLQPLMPRIQNGTSDIEERLENASRIRDEEAAVEALCNIRGIGPALASILLTLTFPEKYAPLDCHTWNALSHLGFDLQKRPNSGGSFTVSELARYLRIIRKLARDTSSTPWEAAKALYALDKVKTRTKWQNKFHSYFPNWQARDA